MSEPKPTYAVTEWQGCYNDSWNGVIVPDAFAHPAKFAPGLISRILRYMLERGYIVAGDSIVDPFGGIGTGGYFSMLLGLHYTGVELEPRFVELGQRNIDKWGHDLRMLNGRLGSARLLRGESRGLLEVVGGGMGAAVGSPPFESTVNHDGGPVQQQGGTLYSDYGSTPGNLAALRADDAGFSAAVSSPPYADAVNGSGEGPGARHDPIYHNGDNAYKQSSANGYGETPGNLGSMAGAGFEAAVSSPPYENSFNGQNDPMTFEEMKAKLKRSGTARMPGPAFMHPRDYGDHPANIGNDTGETFWSAARQIVEQTYAVLKPGGYAAWVTKRFIRKGQIVEFSDQWEALCEAVGFERVERIHALLVDDHGEQLDIFGGAVARRKERKSFFRRLAEKNGSPRIDHEDVIVMRKPL